MAMVRPLSAELRQVAETELNEVPSRVAGDLQALREWLSKQPHLKAHDDDQMLLAFLRGCKFSLEKAKSKLDYFYTLKTMIPEIFVNRGMNERTLALCRSGTYVELPKPFGPGGPRIYLTNYSKLDTNVFKMVDLFKYQMTLMEHQIRYDDNAIISGSIQIIDMSKTSLSFLAQIDFSLIKKIGVFADKATPARLKGIHLLNCPKEAAALLNLGRSLLSTKLQNRFNVHKNVEQLAKVIPLEYLPEDYGGSNGRIADICVKMEQDMLKFDDFFKDDDKYVVDEQLRPGKRLTADTLFGTEGSFRKLDID